ncbi:porin family protein [Hymenobacter sp. AT01-02]|uniref:porin family protein n=1 Tax=Hymenobacter sp. AT01-02 TaxID=1571877 RepID=UPI0006E1C068|nr:porin family protein [Hymenobacter sp. AT01-02]
MATLPAFAQRSAPDYIVTTAGDTLRGRIQIFGPQNQMVRLFREGAATAEFSPTEVRSYGDRSGQLGVSISVGPQGAPQFVVPLVQGYVSLYSGENERGKSHFFLQPADSAYLVPVPPTTARLAYLRVLSGCPSLDFAYSTTEKRYPYTEIGLKRLVTAYNECRQPQQTSRTLRNTSARVAVGLKAGLNSSSFKYADDRYVGSHTNTIGYQAGVMFHLGSKTQFSVQGEVSYVALRSVYGPVNFPNGYAAYTTLRTLTVHYSQIQVPILFRYSFGHQNLRPYVNAGPVYGLNFQNKSTDSYQDSDKPAPNTRAYTVAGSNSFGLSGGAGLLWQGTSFPNLSLEVRYEKMLDATGFYRSAPSHESLRLDLGIWF